MQTLSLSATGFQVLIPVNLVAQIVGTVSMTGAGERPRENFTALCGNFRWREFEVPLFDTSMLITQNQDQAEYERVVVLWPMRSAGHKGFLALTSLGPPRVLDIEAQKSPESPPQMHYASGYVSLDDGLGVIPDLQRLSDDFFAIQQ